MFSQYLGKPSVPEAINPNKWNIENFNYCYEISEVNSQKKHILYDTKIELSTNLKEVRIISSKKKYVFKIKEIIETENYIHVYTTSSNIEFRSYIYKDEDDIFFFKGKTTYVFTNNKK